MEINITPGLYVVAVSGGVDSMVLLDMLVRTSGEKKASNPPTSFVVAHFNHGIRDNSHEDEELVATAANKYGLLLEIGHGNLGATASEDTARRARYEFLESIKQKHNADKIITAHHQDDLIETALINLLRGTGRRGLSSIANNPNVARPLLKYPKAMLVDYANKNQLEWQDDPSNDDPKYLRNYIRKNLMPLLEPASREKLLADLENISNTNLELDKALAEISEEVRGSEGISRRQFTMLPTEIANELVAYWLKTDGIGDYDKKTIERLSVTIKTAHPGTRHNASKNYWLMVKKELVYFSGA